MTEETLNTLHLYTFNNYQLSSNMFSSYVQTTFHCAHTFRKTPCYPLPYIYKIHLILNDIDFLEAFVPGPTSIKDLIQFETLLYMGPDSEVGTIYPLDFIIYVDGAILWNSSFSLTSTEPTGLQVFFCIHLLIAIFSRKL